MKRRRIPLFTPCAIVFSAVPVLILANSTGAQPRSSGAPGEATCNQARCHVGSPVGDQVTITYSGGTSYTPGERGSVTVTIGDTDTRRRYGFQATARLGDNQQAGTLHPGAGVTVLCQDDRTPPCRTDAPLQFSTHSLATDRNTFTFEWTPPATPSGDITIFVAANAANGNGQESGDRIHTNRLRLTPASAAARPSVTQNGVVDPWTRKAGIAPGAWVEIYGDNFTTAGTDWSGSIVNGVLPTTLAGVSVTVNNKPAALSLALRGQLNALIPADAGTGDVQLVVRNAAGESAPVTLRLSEISPVVFAPIPKGDRFDAFLVDNATGALYGAPPAARPARPGDLVQLYALGLGPTDPPLVTDRITGVRAVAHPVQVRFGEVPADVLGAALISPGLYQINLRVPAVADGEHVLTVETGGQRSPGNTVIPVRRN